MFKMSMLLFPSFIISFGYLILINAMHGIPEINPDWMFVILFTLGIISIVSNTYIIMSSKR